MTVCKLDTSDPHLALKKEWLLTNGLGGYAMGTALGANTSKYHGLLIASAMPPVRRVVVLHSIIEQLIVQGQTFDLSTQQFEDGDLLHPDGWKKLVEFTVINQHTVKWKWDFGVAQVTRTLKLIHGKNQAQINYEISCDVNDFKFELRPFTPLRSFHDVMSESTDTPSSEISNDELLVSNKAISVCLKHAGAGSWNVNPLWWRNLRYTQDRDRHQESIEDIYSPGVLQLNSQTKLQSLQLNVQLDCAQDCDFIAIKASQSITKPLRLTESKSGVQQLALAADQFIVHRKSGNTIGLSIIAGYPWFADWGRDALISLPGLLLTRSRFTEARTILETFAKHLHKGLIPNRFDDDTGEPHYNTVDASLWFINAVGEYANASEDHEIDYLLDACRNIIKAYRAGTDYSIHRCFDGLITAGNLITQITWMDATRDGVVFTPRYGKAIEINALWYNALHIIAELTHDEDEACELRELAGHAALSIQMNFWWPEQNCCHDVLVPTDEDWVGDCKLRPNQIFAVSLPHSPLTHLQQEDVVKAVKNNLLTPFGLRTLNPQDEDYCPRYEGNMFERDKAYHQGTVWPWLIGPYCEALLRVNEFSEDSKLQVTKVINPLIAELESGCLGQIAEIYDADPPHRSAGCSAQAWSVASLLRVLHLLEAPCNVAANAQ